MADKRKSNVWVSIRRTRRRITEPFLSAVARSVDFRISSSLVKSAFLSAKLIPYGGPDGDFIVPTVAHRKAGDNFPIPPRELWAGYADNEKDYLACGRSDVTVMLRILEEGGAKVASLLKVLDLGCAAGRMLRFFPSVEGRSELWGLDIDARRIVWCQQNLNPPLNFATVTTSPHLPFEDKTFDLVYCASVFTHISDLADAWFLEIRRILRSGGYAYITIHDNHTLDLLFTNTKYKDDRLFRRFVAQVRRFTDRHSIPSRDYAWFSTGPDPDSQVFYDRDTLVARWSRLARLVSITPEAHGPQTTLLFQK